MLIGLTGKGGSGKTTFAGFIIKYASIPFIQVNFKDALVHMAKKIGWNGIKDEKGRKLLQTLATEVVRDCIDEDYWCNAWFDNIRFDCFIGEKSIVIDDVRFENEAQTIISTAIEKGCEYKIVKLITNNQPEVMTEQAKKHRSEQGIPEELVTNVIYMEYGLNFVEEAAKEFLKDNKILKEGI
jgi:adenylate kinase family enzyme